MQKEVGMRIYKMIFSLIVLGFLFIPGFRGISLAGSSQAGGNAVFPVEEIIRFSKDMEKSLAKHRASVAIIARAGRPRESLPEGVMFTHTAFAVYSSITTKDGKKTPGYVVYNLYQRWEEPDISDLVRDYPVDFMAGAKVLETGVIIPEMKLQKRLLRVIASDMYAGLHTASYSVIANPYTTPFQNCTEHTLDVLFAAIYNTGNLAEIKANQRRYFRAQEVKINRIKLALGSCVIEGLTTDDHQNRIETATFTSIAGFLQEYNLVQKAYILKKDGRENPFPPLERILFGH